MLSRRLIIILASITLITHLTPITNAQDYIFETGTLGHYEYQDGAYYNKTWNDDSGRFETNCTYTYYELTTQVDGYIELDWTNIGTEWPYGIYLETSQNSANWKDWISGEVIQVYAGETLHIRVRPIHYFGGPPEEDSYNPIGPPGTNNDPEPETTTMIHRYYAVSGTVTYTFYYPEDSESVPGIEESETTPVEEPGGPDIIYSVLCSSLDDQGQPVGVTTSFDTGSQVISYITVSNLDMGDVITWDFTGPNGVFETQTYTTDTSGTITVYAVLDTTSYNDPVGSWSLIIDINGTPLSYEEFTVEKDGFNPIPTPIHIIFLGIVAYLYILRAKT